MPRRTIMAHRFFDYRQIMLIFAAKKTNAMNYVDVNTLRIVLQAYKESFDKNWEIEKYKWEALMRFRQEWNIDDEDFGAMFSKATSKCDNLLASRMFLPGTMIGAFAKTDRERVREMFRQLYDESIDLDTRVEAFIAEADSIKAMHHAAAWKNHYQTVYSVSVYLWLRYPDKYYIYKYGVYKSVARVLKSSYIPKPKEKLSKAYGFYDDIRKILAADSELLDMYSTKLTDKYYPDPKFITLTADFGFFTSKHFLGDIAQQFSIAGDNKKINDPTKGVVAVAAKRYWWLNANPKIWSFSNMAIGEWQSYTLYSDNGNKRRIFQNFLDARAGDAVLCYEATPTKRIVALAEIAKDTDAEYMYFKKTETLTEPIDFARIKEDEQLSGMEFITNPNGSLFKLSQKEYDVLMDMIRDSNPAPKHAGYESYGRDNFLEEVYMQPLQFDTLAGLLRHKKNLILQGAPGVGKTFAARRLAYAMMGCRDNTRIESVQFHQNYSYEDFIMGYKPADGGFELQTGIFYRFCIKASNDPEHDYFFIIDEINRGNISKIFGELLMLIEKQYRGQYVTMAYGKTPFCVPENIYIIGMMNTADRSIAIIDYALRRRFCFFDMRPAFDSPGFRKYMKRSKDPNLEKSVKHIEELNEEIARDGSLGSGFTIGHSYLCGLEDAPADRLEQIVRYDIVPLLHEYWFDERDKADKWEKILKSPWND